MGHADDDVVDAGIAGSLNRQIEQRDQRLATLDRKALGPDELLLDELLEDDRVGQAGQNAQLAAAAQLQTVSRPFHALLQPLALGEIVDVHELHANGAAVGFAQPFNDLARRIRIAARERVGGNLLIQIRFPDPVIGGVQFGRGGARQSQRVHAGDHVTAHAVGSDDLIDAILQADRRSHRSIRSRARSGLSRGFRSRWRPVCGGQMTVALFRSSGGDLLEVLPPFVGNGRGIAFVIRVEAFNKGQIHVSWPVDLLRHGEFCGPSPSR